MDKIRADEVKPGQVVHVMGGKYWIRYIRYHAVTVSLSLQPHDEPLSPFYENDAIYAVVNNDLVIEVE